MFNWLRKMLGLCVHKYDKWQVFKSMSSSCGDLKIFEYRTCSKCGHRQIKAQTK